MFEFGAECRVQRSFEFVAEFGEPNVVFLGP
jgi:hypothetical protein